MFGGVASAKEEGITELDRTQKLNKIRDNTINGKFMHSLYTIKQILNKNILNTQSSSAVEHYVKQLGAVYNCIIHNTCDFNGLSDAVNKEINDEIDKVRKLKTKMDEQETNDVQSTNWIYNSLKQYPYSLIK